MSDIQRLEAQIQQMNTMLHEQQRTIEAMCTRIIRLEAAQPPPAINMFNRQPNQPNSFDAHRTVRVTEFGPYHNGSFGSLFGQSGQPFVGFGSFGCQAITGASSNTLP